MNNIMIIDDSWRRGREKKYKAVLGKHFNLIPIEFGKDLFVKIQEETDIDLYLIDIVLDGWEDTSISNTPPRPQELLPVLRKVGKERPVILISNQYENLVKSNKLTSLMNNIIEEGFNNIAGFIVWKEIEKASLELENIDSTSSVRDKIKLEILKYNKLRLNEEQKKSTIGIIAALEEELTPFLDRFRKEELIEEQVFNYTVFRGYISTKNGQNIKFVAARQERMGMVDSSYLASTLISRFEISHLFMIGVCGGRPKSDVNIGDIIIPKESVAYQNGKLTDSGFAPDTGTALSNSSMQQHLTVDYNIKTLRELYDEFDKLYKDAKGISLGVTLPKVKYDEMACGDIIVDKKSFIDRIAKRTSKRKLCSVDMESYSILRACNLFPFRIYTTVIKSVMDNSSDKNDIYKPYAAFMSAGFLYRILVDGKYQV